MTSTFIIVALAAFAAWQLVRMYRRWSLADRLVQLARCQLQAGHYAVTIGAELVARARLRDIEFETRILWRLEMANWEALAHIWEDDS